MNGILLYNTDKQGSRIHEAKRWCVAEKFGESELVSLSQSVKQLRERAYPSSIPQAGLREGAMTRDRQKEDDVSYRAGSRPTIDELRERVDALEESNEELREDTERLREVVEDDPEPFWERVEALEATLAGIAPRAGSTGGGAGPEPAAAPDERIQSDGGSATYKVLGQFAESNEGIGVLGCNTASTGTTYGVKGEVDSSDGYGLMTPDDCKIDGALAGDLTGNIDVARIAGIDLRIENGALEAIEKQLPRLSDIGNQTEDVLDGLNGRFGATSWTALNYASGANCADSGSAFRGAVTAPTGYVVFVPWDDNVGIYDPVTDTYSSGDAHGEEPSAFRGGTVAPTGDVIFAPFNSTHVGIYDPVADSYSSGSTHGEASNAFSAAVLAPTGDVILVPSQSDYVGIYDPETDSYTRGDTHGEGDYAFGGGVVGQTGDIIFAPNGSGYVGIYDPETDIYTRGDSHSEFSNTFTGAALAPTGDVVFVPSSSEHVGIYDPVSDSYTSGAAVQSGSNLYEGGVLTQAGTVVFAPDNSDYVGVYDPVTDQFQSAGYHNEGDYAFSGVALAPTGTAVLAPYNSSNVGLMETFVEPLTHPLLNNS